MTNSRLKKLYDRSKTTSEAVSESIHVPLSENAEESNNTLSSPVHSHTRYEKRVHSVTVEACEHKKRIFKASLPGSLLEESATGNRQELAFVNTTLDESQVSDQSEKGALFNTLRAPFQQDEIILGPKLGSGEFSNVYEIKSFRLKDGNLEREWTEEETQNRCKMKKIEKYHDTDQSRYALKHLKEEYLSERGAEEYVQAAW